MIATFIWRRLLSVLAILFGLAASASAQPLTGTILGTWSDDALSRLSQPAETAEALAVAPDGRISVIVMLRDSGLPAITMADGPEDDARRIAAVHGQIDSFVARHFQTAGPLVEFGLAAVANSQPELELERFDFTPMFVLRADSVTLGRLAADPQVLAIQLNRRRALPRHDLPADPALDGLASPALGPSEDERSVLDIIEANVAYAAGSAGADGRGSDGTRYRVAVLDTGARHTHEFLSGRIASTACYSRNSGGYFSLCDRSATSATGAGTAPDCSASNWRGCGHGTHVAGIAAGSNGTGGVPRSGVARAGRLIVINVFSLTRDCEDTELLSGQNYCISASDSNIIEGLERVYALRNSHSIAAVNMSLGDGRYSSVCDDREPALTPAVNNLHEAGIAVIASAGNEGRNAAIGSPACIRNVIAVAASDRADRRWSSSNWGELVDLVAPGVDVLSSYTVCTGSNCPPIDRRYRRSDGTSMAAPVVAGAFALLRSEHPNATVAQMLSALRATGTPVTAAGVTRPRINVAEALNRMRPSSRTGTMTGLLTGASTPWGAPITLSGVVRTTPSAPGVIPGRLVFLQDGRHLQTMTLSNDRASFNVTNLPPGEYRFTAIYPGGWFTPGAASGGWYGMSQRTVTHTVGPAITSVALTGTQIVTEGEAIRLSARVTTGPGSQITPGGRVRFNREGLSPGAESEIVTIDLLRGLAVYERDAPPGRYRITAEYLGVPDRLEGSASAAHTVTVRHRTTTALTMPDRLDFGTDAVLRAQVTASGATPTGEVVFLINDETEFARQTLTNGATEVTVEVDRLDELDDYYDDYGVAANTPGTAYRFRAEYRGDGLFAPSVSRNLTRIPRWTTELTLSGPESSRQGEAVRLEARITSPAPDLPAGRIEFSHEGAELGSVELADGGAVLEVTGLPVGEQLLEAHYLRSDSAYHDSAATLRHRVLSNLVQTETSLTGAERVLVGEAAVFEVRVTAQSGNGGAQTEAPVQPGGMVRLMRNGTEVAAAALEDGAQRFEVTGLALGVHVFHAEYTGDDNFDGSESAPLRVTMVAPNPAFLGGGAVFGQSTECGPALGAATQGVTVHYAPSELGGLPSGVSLVWADGSEHLALWGPMAAGGDFFGGAGRSSWTRFVFYPTRPLIRIARRQVTLPPGAELEAAQELLLRLRVQNFAAIQGCTVTIAAILRRGG